MFQAILFVTLPCKWGITNDLDAQLADIQADLDNPDQYKADTTKLLKHKSCLRGDNAYRNINKHV